MSFVTRDTVDSCMSMCSATSRSVRGRRCSTPFSKKSRCRSTMKLMTFSMVWRRCSIQRANGFADALRVVADRPEEVVIFGIEPATVEGVMELSPTLAARLDELVEALLARIGLPAEHLADLRRHQG
mgnify:CR=1 FL=1